MMSAAPVRRERPRERVSADRGGSLGVVTTLLLARHGETDWNREHRWQGHAGPPLNDTGRRQALALAQRLPVVDAVYSSDTERAYETAQIVAEPRGLEVRTDARLREVNFGLWEGLTRGEIDERFGDGFPAG
jgi:broad specificity phosphatase PhoE